MSPFATSIIIQLDPLHIISPLIYIPERHTHIALSTNSYIIIQTQARIANPLEHLQLHVPLLLLSNIPSTLKGPRPLPPTPSLRKTMPQGNISYMNSGSSTRISSSSYLSSKTNNTSSNYRLSDFTRQTDSRERFFVTGELSRSEKDMGRRLKEWDSKWEDISPRRS